MKFVVLFLFSVALGGCFGLAREDKESGAAAGQFCGAPIEIRWQREANGTTRIDLPPVAAIATGLMPPPWGQVAGGVLALLTGSAAVAAKMASSRANEHKADADEGWKRALETNTNKTV